MALLSGLAALALLLLPLMLVLLMELFETTAHGVLVLMGMLVDWLSAFMPAGQGGLPPFQTVMLHPLGMALGSLLRALPCLAGLVLVLSSRGQDAGWWWTLPLWGLAAVIGGKLVALVLLPGLVSAAMLAWRSRAAAKRSSPGNGQSGGACGQ